MSRLQEAMAAVRANPKDPQAWTVLGERLAEDRQWDKAKQSFQRALQLAPASDAAQRGLAQVLAAEQAAAAPPATPVLPEEPTPRAAPPARPSTPTPASRPTPTVPADAPPDERGRLETVPPEARPARPSAPSFREPPPAPVKPSRARMWFGAVLLIGLPLLCACVALLILANTI